MFNSTDVQVGLQEDKLYQSYGIYVYKCMPFIEQFIYRDVTMVFAFRCKEQGVRKALNGNCKHSE